MLAADGAVIVTAGRDVDFDEFSSVAVDQDTGGAGSVSTVQISAGGDISLDGLITALHTIEATAGVSGSGSVNATINARLTTSGSDITLEAGSDSGDVVLSGAMLNEGYSTGTLTLLAPGGMISQSDSTLSAKELLARAEQGITLMTNVGQLDVQNTGSGDIDLLSVRSTALIAPLSNPSGKINATVFGVLTAGNIQADEITIRATGGLVQQDSTAIQGGTLTLDTNSGDSTLRTELSDLVIRTGGIGNLTINNIGTSPLTLNINVTDGSLTVDTAVTCWYRASAV
jgi:hypothetical protein